MNPTNDERARFEAWAVKEGFNLAFSPPWELAAESTSWYSCYESQPTRVAARGWLACSQPAPAAQGEAVAWADDDFYGDGSRMHSLQIHPDPMTNAGIIIGALCARLDTARRALASAAAMQVVQPALSRIKDNAAWAMHETDPRRVMPRSAAYEPTPQPSAPGVECKEVESGFSLNRSDESLVDCALQVYARACAYNTESQHAAAMQYRAEILRRLAAAQPSADDARLAGVDKVADAKRYIRDWCPDHVKDYVDSLSAAPPADAQDAEDARRYRKIRHGDFDCALLMDKLSNDKLCMKADTELDAAIDAAPDPADRAMGGE